MTAFAGTLEHYLIEVVNLRGKAVPETSRYAALKDLLNAAGETLKPRINAIIHPANTGAGIPDLGLFDEQQPAGQAPAHGVVEAKPTDQSLAAIIASEQVARYVQQYGQVLVTNYYEFILVVRDAAGKPAPDERFSLAASESAFWQEAAQPRVLAAQHGDALKEYLLRVLRRTATLTDPREVAWVLASYARVARIRIEQRDVTFSEFAGIRADLERSLGIHFEGKEGDQFFRSTLIQTFFYGIFASWVLWSEEPPVPDDRFNLWRDTRRLPVPVLQELFYQLMEPQKLRRLGIEDVLLWVADALNRVDQAAFFATFRGSEAVQYFYEPFLEAFDPDLRRQLGVWYTPTEIVQYMVARVDTALKTELGIAQGLADPDVYVLDPCCGTGAYLVGVLQHLYAHVRQADGELAAGNAVRTAIQKRIFGFEILPAPYVIAHLQLNMLLAGWNAPLETWDRERAGVYLTNALTGWRAGEDGVPQQLFLRGLERERDAADAVKRGRKILVVIGNPPYNAFAGTSPDEEAGLVNVYKEGLISEWGIRKFNLDDLYVRFLRLAERCITELNAEQRGLICYVSNFSYVSDPSFVIARQRLLDSFDSIWIDSLNGDSRETGKRIPKGLPNEGQPDPSAFSTEANREGIRVGTAVSLMVRRRAEQRPPTPTVRYRDFWGVNKRADLLASLAVADFDGQYQQAAPHKTNRYALRPRTVGDAYLSWQRVTDLCAVPPHNGPIERRGMALIDIDKEKLTHRVRSYFDKSISNAQVALLHPKLMMTGNRIVGADAREKILSEFQFDESRIVRYPFKPYDTRWCYLENLRPLFSEPSPELLALRAIPNNAWFVTRDTADKEDEGVPFFYSSLVCDYDLLSGHARHFPLFVQRSNGNGNGKSKTNGMSELPGMPASEMRYRANLSDTARTWLADLGITDMDDNPASAALVWLHALAIGYTPDYLHTHAAGIKDDFPRIPLPTTADQLRESAVLGARVAALLDSERLLEGVTTGTIDPALRTIAILSTTGTPDYRVTAGWGHLSQGAVMPGRGRLLLTADGAYDVYLNETTYWRNVPQRVWNYTIGGYQVLKKWLSYREHAVIERPLNEDEQRGFMHIARRLATLIALEDALNANYQTML